MVIDWQRPENYLAAPSSTILFPWVFIGIVGAGQHYEDTVSVVFSLTAVAGDKFSGFESFAIPVTLEPTAEDFLAGLDAPRTTVVLTVEASSVLAGIESVPVILTFEASVQSILYGTEQPLIVLSLSTEAVDILTQLIRGGLGRVVVEDRLAAVGSAPRLTLTLVGDKRDAIKRGRTSQTVEGAEDMTTPPSRRRR